MTMSAQDRFREFLAGVAADLRARGFKRKGGIFRRDVPGFAQFVTYQKSRHSDQDSISFTVNLGVDLEALHFLAAQHNSVHDCPWHMRLGQLLDAHGDYWWTLSGADNPDRLVAEHRKYLGSVIWPTLDKAASTDYLIDEWQRGRAPGATEGQRRVYLAVLLKLRGQPGDQDLVMRLLDAPGRIPGLIFEFEETLGPLSR
jgi:hypothetical protein